MLEQKDEFEERKVDTKRTTLHLPMSLHKQIKLEAVESDRDMTEIIVEQLSARYKAQSKAEGQLRAA